MTTAKKATRNEPNVSRDGYGFYRQRNKTRKVIVNISWTKYIRRELAGEYERLGWEIRDSLAGTHHGEYSVIGVWKGSDNPPVPEADKAQDSTDRHHEDAA